MNRTIPSLIKLFSGIILALIIIGYSLFQAHSIITGPEIDVYSPQNGTVYSHTLIEISGQAHNTSFLNLNKRQIFTDRDGYFKEKLLLSPGYNILVLDAKDKFGKTTEKRLELILKEY
jgi:hypothetical protein